MSRSKQTESEVEKLTSRGIPCWLRREARPGARRIRAGGGGDLRWPAKSVDGEKIRWGISAMGFAAVERWRDCGIRELRVRFRII